MEVFKIRNKKTGLFSKGGTRIRNDSSWDWSEKCGKSWTGTGPLRNHLNQYKADEIKDWEIVRFETSVTDVVPAIAMYQNKAKFDDLKAKPVKEAPVDPLDEANWNKPLWCVHGHDAHPSVHCLMLKKDHHGSWGAIPNVWGYSVWKRQPGFRTLGLSLTKFHENKDLHLYFATKQGALDYLSAILEPKL